ncbi:GGDEF domain-containing response regulator [Allorhizobium undicola]|uniref:GGDEF domain-containing response regulator n=1 Tax=Allorhizobium undicola TaxID=78527 RepID=UPI000484A811|nr:diguanylate cyclase [Allorhizobium undicola]
MSEPRILLIEDSPAMSALLMSHLQKSVSAEIVHCRSHSEAESALQSQDFTVAITGMNLPDAPNGEILNLLCSKNIPTVLFSASVIDDLVKNYASRRLVDYIVKDGVTSVEKVATCVVRVINNRSTAILVVDDMKTSRSELSSFLKGQNFLVFEASTGKEALRILGGNPAIELVVTDYFMPDMDGYELTQTIKTIYGSDRLRIIGVSASTDRRLSASFLKAGASDFIYRPFLPEELQCRINNNVETLLQLKRLRYMAERDFLTSLYNRRLFFERAENFLASGTKGAIAILDIDHFKSLNDTYGHETGDRVLKAVASLLAKGQSEGRYLAARIGGEEFALLFMKTDRDGAIAIAQALLSDIQGMALDHAKGPIRITASIGVVKLAPDEPLDNQLNAADQMLYLAKSRGRNRLCSDQPFDEA